MKLDALILVAVIASAGVMLLVQFVELAKLDAIQEEVQILGGYVIHD